LRSTESIRGCNSHAVLRRRVLRCLVETVVGVEAVEDEFGNRGVNSACGFAGPYFGDKVGRGRLQLLAKATNVIKRGEKVLGRGGVGDGQAVAVLEELDHASELLRGEVLVKDVFDAFFDETPDHSSLSRIRCRLPWEVFEAVHEYHLIDGTTVGVDSTVLEAHAADTATLVPRLQQAQEHWDKSTGLLYDIKKVVADTGYHAAKTLDDCRRDVGC